MTKNEIKEILTRNKDVLKKHRVKSIALFGSFVRGDMKRQSDIDFLVEFDKTAFGENFEGYFDNYRGLVLSLENIFGRKIDLLTTDMISPYIKSYIMQEAEYFEAA